MTRVSRRRQLFYVFIAAFASIFIITTHRFSLDITTDTNQYKKPDALPHHTAINISSSRKDKEDDDKERKTTTGRGSDSSKNQFSKPYKNFVKPSPSQLPWYMRGGQKRPATAHHLKLSPDEDEGDRIENQLMYVQPLSIDDDHSRGGILGSKKASESKETLKIIMTYSGFSIWANKEGQHVFKDLKCPVDMCYFTGSRKFASKADAIIMKDSFSSPPPRQNPNQIWILFLLESPLHTGHSHTPFNWTATYRHDSDIVAPYEKYAYYDPTIRQIEQTKNYAAGKTKKVAWFVSNCGDTYRLNFARKLSKYIQVDIYGACGEYTCPRKDHNCFEMLRKDYKFYLAFENSRCRDYITEKFFVNGLSNDVIPIAMGAAYEDYVRAAPENSFIHVDNFSSVQALAEYLHHLDKNDHEYNSFFRWKGTGEFINTYFMCRTCAMLHANRPPKHYNDVGTWWAGPGICVSGSWKDYFKENNRHKDGIIN